MSRFIRGSVVVGAFIVVLLTGAGRSFATVPPTLALAATGSGDQVTVQVTGDPNASVLLSYSKPGAGPTIVSLGTTNGSGQFTDTISSASYGLSSGLPVTAILGGTSGPKSPTVYWPSVTSANTLSLDRAAVVVSVGSSASVSVLNSGGSALYVSNNSNPSIANVSITGSSAAIVGNVVGQTTVTLCTVGITANCPSVYVTVTQAGSGQLSFSNANPSVVSGQNLPITVTGGTGSYVLINNTNPSTISATLSGSVLTLSTGASTGSSSITVCTSDQALCGVVVASAASTNSVTVSFSTNAPVVAANQSTNVSVYGPTGVQFYVSSNSNPSIVQANLSGTTLTLTGISAGTSAISVCASSGTCASVTATVSAVAAIGPITLSQNTLTLQPGSNVAVTVSGGQPPYALVGGSPSIAQAVLSGSTLTVTGVGAGTASLDVCSSGGGCTNLSVTVGAAGTSGVTLSPSTAMVAIGQSVIVSLSGASSYYLSGNTSSNVATVAVSGAIASIAGLSPGSTVATICGSGSSCATLSISVAAPVSTGGSTGSTVASPPVSSGYTFTEYLAPGKQDAEVLQLQKTLAAQGYFTHVATGYYGAVTEAAVIKFQAAHGIEQLGVVGPSTRAALNALSVASSSSAASATGSDISTMTLAQLKLTVQELQAQLNQVLSRIAQLSGN